jgi:hypothetical protein
VRTVSVSFTFNAKIFVQDRSSRDSFSICSPPWFGGNQHLCLTSLPSTPDCRYILSFHRTPSRYQIHPWHRTLSPTLMRSALRPCSVGPTTWQLVSERAPIRPLLPRRYFASARLLQKHGLVRDVSKLHPHSSQVLFRVPGSAWVRQKHAPRVCMYMLLAVKAIGTTKLSNISRDLEKRRGVFAGG